MEYKAGPLLQNSTMEFAEIYSKDYQRRRLHTVFDDHDRNEWHANELKSE